VWRVVNAPWRIATWNVNGLRAAHRKGFAAFLARSRSQILGVQEVRAFVTQLPPELACPRRWHTHFTEAERPGYSGVGLFSRVEPDDAGSGLDVPRFDVEGRFQWMRFGRLIVANVYFPKGSGRLRDNSRVPYKLDFYRAVFDRLQRWRRGGRRVLAMGDYNTAHEEIDLARPRGNRETSGFLPEERAELSRWVEAGWVDTFRAVCDEPGHYTWWSQRLGVRARNVGWRIDYVLASPAAMRFVTDAFIWPKIMGSDHCPAGVVVNPAICR
jgi:exodeoxyribonuclease-3